MNRPYHYFYVYHFAVLSLAVDAEQVDILLYLKNPGVHCRVHAVDELPDITN